MPSALRAIWDETLHPRDAGGRWINRGENVELPDGSVGKVVGAHQGVGGPDVLVHKGDGSVVNVKAADTSITADAPSAPAAEVVPDPDPLGSQRIDLVGQYVAERQAFDDALTPTKERAALHKMIVTEDAIDKVDHDLAVLRGDPLPSLPHEYAPGSDTIDFDAMRTNPDYFLGDGYTINCAHVVNAYELRRRGYRVSATRLPDNMVGRQVQQVLNTWTDASGQHRAMTLTRTATVANIINNWPPGARGWIAVNWKTGGGHVFNVEKTPEGAVNYVDAQTNTVMDPTTVSTYWNRATPLAKIARVDDLTPSNDVLQFISATSDLPEPMMDVNE